MAAISSCPSCAKQISVPQGASPLATVRCPLCDAEYQLQDALDLAPPLLVVVSAPADDDLDLGDALASGIAAEGDDVTLLESSFEESVPQSSDVDVDPEEADTELEAAGSVASADDGFDDLIPSSEGGEANELTGDPQFAPSEAFGEADAYAVAPSDDDLFAPSPVGEGGDLDDSNSAASIAVATRRVKQREPSALGTLIGVVGGGVFGCGMALMIVLWIGGPAFDFADLGSKLPWWMLPPSVRNANSATKTPLSDNPTAADLAEVKKAAKDAGFAATEADLPFAVKESETPAEEPKAETPAATDPAAEVAAEKPTEDPELPTDPGDVAASLQDDPLAGAAPAKAAPADKPVDDAADAFGEAPAEEKTAEPAAEDVAADPAAEEPKADPAAETPAADPAEAAPAEVEQTSATEVAEVGPKHPKNFTADELKTTLEAASKLGDELASADAAKVRGLKRDYYQKMFELGQVTTYAKGDDAVDGQAAIATMLAEIATDPKRVDEIGNVSTQWLKLDAAKRGADKGVLLAGVVEEVGQVGDLHRTKIKLSKTNEPVDVYSVAAPDAAAGDTVIVLGSIVVSPKEAIHNFTGDEATVVWLGTAIKAGG